ncbi:RNA polymerase sigma factor, sigma-70 family [Chitinophaga sp. CF118]|uniref:RNA polymerase sigma factor n=1 Tax=Chitinophaga sp. CF118 TaxID=1884367 RepID=UPI0008EAD135|nr:sigma-70 family RNA polymerase sigma factor [Chitinophaga sp. CF118]SFD10013.1 RNA polymerase sigma factor, sigma-70 family [Chitinophaga sp. CF118]
MANTPFDINNFHEDEALIKQIKSGNYDAFTLLYNKYIRQLTQYGLKFNTDLPIIQDCLHDVFVWLWANRHKLAIHHSVKSYLFKAVRTSILHILEKKNKLRTLHPEEGNEYNFELELSPENLMLQDENREQIRVQIEGLMRKLTAKQKEVIYLRYYEGLNFEDIAQNMNLSVKASYKLMGRAIATLRENVPSSQVLLIILLHLH